MVARCNGEIIAVLRSGQFSWVAGRDLRDLTPNSIVKITVTCNLIKTQGETSWLGARDSNPDNVVQRERLTDSGSRIRSASVRGSSKGRFSNLVCHQRGLIPT
jgi:hypothetical protein